MATPTHRTASHSQLRSRVSRSEMSLRHLLRSAQQDLWLDTIRRTRSDAHNSLVYWMLSQPECDFAVAAHAFYRSNPTFHVEHPAPLSARPGPDNIFALVLVNWDTGFFRNHNLRVDPVDAHPRIVQSLNEMISALPRASLPFSIPPELLNPEGGVPMSLPKRLSPEHAPQLWPIYADMGLSVPPVQPGFKRTVENTKAFLRKARIIRK